MRIGKPEAISGIAVTHLLFAWVVMSGATIPALAQGVITTIAGASWSFRGDGKAALDAPLGTVEGLSLAADGSLITIDTQNCLIFRIAPAGTIHEIGGNGICGRSGDGGRATAASISMDPEYGGGYGNGYGSVLAASGDLYFADTRNGIVRKIDPNGVITTIAGGGPSIPFGTSILVGDGSR